MHARATSLHDAQATCDHCRQPFKPSKSWQRFCTRKCRDAHHNGGNQGTDLARKVAELEKRIVELEAMAWPLGK